MKIVIIILIIFYIDFTISMFLIFKKTKINNYYALIPFLNLYYYVVMCELKPIVLLIPIANIFLLIMLPYQLGYEFGQNKIISLLGFFFPLLFFPYIAFSKVEYIHKNYSKLNINSLEDIDKLEKEILENEKAEETYQNKENKKEKIKKDEKSNYVNNLITSIEDKSMQQNDELYQDEDLQVKKEKVKVTDLMISPSITDLNEDENVDSNNSIDELENKLNDNSKIKIEDISNYKEVKSQEEEVNVIAFGDLSSKKDEKEQKHELICPYCHASMIGFHKTCPGCGRNISNLMNDIQKD